MQLHLRETKEVQAGVTTFIWDAPEPVKWQAGQYGVFNLPHDNPDNEGTERFFTISAAPFEGHIAFTTRITQSTFKQALSRLQPGDAIELKEVNGDFVVNDTQRSMVFIAGGIGITPFRSILTQLHHDGQPVKVQLLYGNRDEHIIFKDQLEAIQSDHPELVIDYVLAPTMITGDYIKRVVADLSAPLFYVSGPEPMVEGMEKVLADLGISEEQQQRDYFPGYEYPEK